LQLLEELKIKIRSLTFPQRLFGKELIRKYSTAKNVAITPDEQKISPHLDSSHRCCILLIKPVEKILIRYLLIYLAETTFLVFTLKIKTANLFLKIQVRENAD
jgi:hypothetical protein